MANAPLVGHCDGHGVLDSSKRHQSNRILMLIVILLLYSTGMIHSRFNDCNRARHSHFWFVVDENEGMNTNYNLHIQFQMMMSSVFSITRLMINYSSGNFLDELCLLMVLEA